MCDQCKVSLNASVSKEEFACVEERSPAPSRRDVIAAGAGLLAGTMAVQVAPDVARAQGAADAGLAQLQQARRIVLKGGIVLSLDPKVGDFAAGDVLIEDGKIREVRPNIDVSADAAAIVDASSRILIPGFVDTHSHSYQGLLRNSLANGLVDPDYNRDVQNKWTPACTPADVYAGVLITALGFIDMGTTAIIDLSQISHTPEHSDACISALQDAGIRAVYGYSRGAGDAVRWPQDIARLQKTYFSSKDQLLTLALGASLDAKVVAAAREAGVPAVMHYRVNPAPGLALAKAGVLREGDLFIHCTHLNDEAWRMIKDIGGRISMSPPIEMAMAHGMPAIQDALDRGIRPSLSSDHGTTVGQDCFSMMRTTFNLQRLRVLQRRRSGESDTPPLVTCRDVLDFATLQGARCASIDGKVGTLTPGKEADILMLRADRIDVWPLNNAPSVVANFMNPGHVENVFIGGKPRKWRGNLAGVDMSRVLRLARDARDGLMRRTNSQMNLLG
jgi:5-methylthioadenosine/S-adenosylhomocysteine deaminase